jgi:hypothetical protein
LQAEEKPMSTTLEDRVARQETAELGAVGADPE